MKLEEVAGQKALSTEEKCLAYLEGMRWPDGVRCPQCTGGSISRFQTKGKTGKVRHLYQCLDKTCRYQFSATTGTIFHDSHLPLNKWFNAIALLCDSDNPISVNQLRTQLGVQYKTASHVAGRIRKAMVHGTIELRQQADMHGATGKPDVAPAIRESIGREAPAGRVSPRPSQASLADTRSVTASLLNQVSPMGPKTSPTTIDNMLSMFVSLTQISVKPPLFFVKYIRDKVFT